MLKVLELFGGIGAPRKALERLGIEHKIVDYVEIDKYAVKSYNAIYGKNYEPQDVTQWNKNIDVDLIFHGSPCQDFSTAGKGAGGEEDSGTRSSLMWHTVRIVEKLKPKYVIWENVKAVISKKHIETFDKYLEKMKALGYTNYYQVLNAKNYEIPQNRERVFTVSIFGNDNFTFPPKQELKLRLKNMLEEEVDEKYYLSDKMVDYVSKIGTETYKAKPSFNNEIARAINSSCHKMHRAGIDNYIEIKSKCKRLKKLISNTSFEKGKILNLDTYNQTTNEDISQTLTEPHHNNHRLFDGYRIRKLTPLECWRLMGFDDEDFYKAEQVNSNSQLYKQAGNSIVVNVLEAIFKELL